MNILDHLALLFLQLPLPEKLDEWSKVSNGVILLILWFMWRRMDQMATKDNLRTAILELEVRLERRFPSRKEFEALVKDSDQTAADLRECKRDSDCR